MLLNTPSLLIDHSLYALLDGSNQPFTGNIEVLNALAELKITNPGDSNSARIVRTDAFGKMSILNTVMTQGGIGNALRFNGIDESVIMVGSKGTALDVTGDEISISVWIKPNTLPAGLHRILGNRDGNNGYAIRLNGTTLEFFVFLPGPIVKIATKTISAGSYLHIFARYDGSNVEIFVDDVPGTSSAASGNIIAGSVDFEIGAVSGIRYFDGDIDECFVWDRAVTNAEKTDLGQNLFVNPSSTFPSTGTSMGLNLVGGWHKDENLGTNAADSSTVGNDGTLQNMGDINWVEGVINLEGSDNEVNALSIKDGIDPNQGYVITFGDSSHPGEIISVGDEHNWKIDGNSVMGLDANGTLTLNNGLFTAQALKLIGAVMQSEYLLTLQDSNFIDTNLFGVSGVKLMANAGGDITCFEDVDVENTANGKSFIVYRKAAEGDDSMKMWFDQFRTGYLEYTNNLILRCDGGNNIDFGRARDNNFRFGNFASAGVNPTIRHYGYITAPATHKYIQWLLNDTTDWYELTREDTNIFGFDIQMPLNVTKNIRGQESILAYGARDCIRYSLMLS